jgi:uncharacterized BrkB/YihY/UPF0761 family membrane protein
MENSDELSEEQFWKGIIKEYRNPFIIAIIAGICVFIGALLVGFWFMEITPLGRGGAALVGEWRLNWVVGFMLLVTVFELLFVGVPAGLFFGLGGYLWWHNLAPEKKQVFKDREKKKTKRKQEYGGGGGFGFFMFLAYCIYHGMANTYNAPFSSHPYSYWVYTWFLTLMWIFIYFGIPVAIICIVLYFTKWKKK